MLLLLAEYLQQFHTGFAVFQYLSLRGILGVLTALVLSLWLGVLMSQQTVGDSLKQACAVVIVLANDIKYSLSEDRRSDPIVPL